MRTLNIHINNEITNGTINYTNIIGDSFAHYQSNVRNSRKDSRGNNLPDFSKLECKVKRFMENQSGGYFNTLSYMWNELDGQIDITVNEKNSSMQFTLTIQDDAEIEYHQIVHQMDMMITKGLISEYPERFEYVDPEHRYTWSVYGKNKELIKWLDEQGHFSNWVKVLI